jgi:hypothetical protein
VSVRVSGGTCATSLRAPRRRFRSSAPSRRLFVRLRDDIDERLLVPFDAERLPDSLLRERDEPSSCRASSAVRRGPTSESHGRGFRPGCSFCCGTTLEHRRCGSRSGHYPSTETAARRQRVGSFFRPPARVSIPSSEATSSHARQRKSSTTRRLLRPTCGFAECGASDLGEIDGAKVDGNAAVDIAKVDETERKPTQRRPWEQEPRSGSHVGVRRARRREAVGPQPRRPADWAQNRRRRNRLRPDR